MIDENKQKVLDTAIGQIKKQYGKDSIMKLSENADMSIATVPTGSLALDVALGVGGIPKGRIIEIYGAEGGGKTTLSLHIAAETQKQGGVVAFIDAEHALDPIYAQAIGVNVDDLYVSQPNSGEQALEITETLVRSGVVDLVIIDSVAALTPQAEIDGDMGDAHVGLLARLMSQACRKLTAAASQTNCTIIFINQIREKVGVLYGNPEVTTGGRALKFYSSVRLDVRRTETIKIKGEPIGNKVKIKVVKNKVAPPFKEAITEIVFGKGIDHTGEEIDLAVDFDIIQKRGGWYTLPNGDQVQGKDAVREFYDNHVEDFEELDKELRSILFEKFENPTNNLLEESDDNANFDPETGEIYD